MQRSTWLWPILLLLSALGTWIVYAVLPASVLHPLIVLWFLTICPGMALVRFLRQCEPITEWTLAVATSLVLDTFVTSIQVYTHRWSPSLALSILIGVCIAGAFGQLLVLLVSQIQQRHQRRLRDATELS